MRDATVWRQMLGVDRATVIVKVSFEGEGDEDIVVVQVRQRRSKKPACGKCGALAPGYDRRGPEALAGP